MKTDRFLACGLLLLAALEPGIRAPAAEFQQPPAGWGVGRPIIQPAAHLAPALLAAEVQPAPALSPFVDDQLPVEPGMMLEELESIALGNNPTLVQAAMRVRAARAKAYQASLYPNPVIGYQGDEMGDTGTAGQQGGFVRQEIVTAGKLRLRSTVAAHEAQQAQRAWEVQRWRVLNDVRSGWYQVQAAQQIVALHQTLVEIGRKSLQAAEDLLQALEVSEVDVLQAQVEVHLAQLQLDDAQHNHLAVWRRLAAVLGMPDMALRRLAGELSTEAPPLNWADALGRLLGESPELAEARAAVERARCAVVQQYAERIPNFEVRTGVRHSDVTGDTLIDVEVGLPLPIFNRNQGNISRARAELIAAEHEVRRVELALHDRLAVAFARFAKARHRAERYSTSILPNAKDSLELIRKGYMGGQFRQEKLLAAERTHRRANLAYLESLLELRQSAAEIEGFLLSGGLEKMADD